jgi:hypothetical protein
MKRQQAPTEIESATIARGIDKLTHETFYVVQSDSDPNIWHQVRWSNERLAWQCNGEECRYQADGTACKHARAVNDVLRIRRQQIALAMGGQTPAIVAKLQAKEDRKLAQAVQGTMAREVSKLERAPSGRAVPMR